MAEVQVKRIQLLQSQLTAKCVACVQCNIVACLCSHYCSEHASVLSVCC